ncbi:MAG TPA: zinc ribbon domain-containing protein [Thermoanaerobaculia bacterium]
MYCNRCGTHNPDDAHFCSKCGAAVKAGAAPPPAATPPAAPHAPAAHGAVHAAPVNPKGFVFPTLSMGDILDRESARAHTMAGFVAAILGVLFSLFAAKMFGSVMIGMAALYAVIAFGLWRSSRTAAILGLLVAIGNAIATVVMTNGAAPKVMLIVVVLFVIAYWNAARGTFAEHRLGNVVPRGAVRPA